VESTSVNQQGKLEDRELHGRAEGAAGGTNDYECDEVM
jgi:hypothetical protein